MKGFLVKIKIIEGLKRNWHARHFVDEERREEIWENQQVLIWW